jgi:hypothetical protein
MCGEETEEQRRFKESVARFHADIKRRNEEVNRPGYWEERARQDADWKKNNDLLADSFATYKVRKADLLRQHEAEVWAQVREPLWPGAYFVSQAKAGRECSDGQYMPAGTGDQLHMLLRDTEPEPHLSPEPTIGVIAVETESDSLLDSISQNTSAISVDDVFDLGDAAIPETLLVKITQQHRR